MDERPQQQRGASPSVSPPPRQYYGERSASADVRVTRVPHAHRLADSAENDGGGSATASSPGPPATLGGDSCDTPGDDGGSPLSGRPARTVSSMMQSAAAMPLPLTRILSIDDARSAATTSDGGGGATLSVPVAGRQRGPALTGEYGDDDGDGELHTAAGASYTLSNVGGLVAVSRSASLQRGGAGTRLTAGPSSGGRGGGGGIGSPTLSCSPSTALSPLPLPLHANRPVTMHTCAAVAAAAASQAGSTSTGASAGPPPLGQEAAAQVEGGDTADSARAGVDDGNAVRWSGGVRVVAGRMTKASDAASATASPERAERTSGGGGGGFWRRQSRNFILRKFTSRSGSRVADSPPSVASTSAARRSSSKSASAGAPAPSEAKNVQQVSSPASLPSPSSMTTQTASTAPLMEASAAGAVPTSTATTPRGTSPSISRLAMGAADASGPREQLQESPTLQSGLQKGALRVGGSPSGVAALPPLSTPKTVAPRSASNHAVGVDGRTQQLQQQQQEAQHQQDARRRSSSSSSDSTTSTDTNPAPILPPPPTASFAEAIWGTAGNSGSNGEHHRTPSGAAAPAAGSSSSSSISAKYQPFFLQYAYPTASSSFFQASEGADGEDRAVSTARAAGAADGAATTATSTAAARSLPHFASTGAPQPRSLTGHSRVGVRESGRLSTTTVTDTTARVSPRSPAASPPSLVLVETAHSGHTSAALLGAGGGGGARVAAPFPASVLPSSISGTPAASAAPTTAGVAAAVVMPGVHGKSGRPAVSQSVIIAAWNRMGARSTAASTGSWGGVGAGGGAAGVGSGLELLAELPHGPDALDSSSAITQPAPASVSAEEPHGGPPRLLRAPSRDGSPTAATGSRHTTTTTAGTHGKGSGEHAVVMPVRRRSVVTRQRGPPPRFSPSRENADEPVEGGWTAAPASTALSAAPPPPPSPPPAADSLQVEAFSAPLRKPPSADSSGEAGAAAEGQSQLPGAGAEGMQREKPPAAPPASTRRAATLASPPGSPQDAAPSLAPPPPSPPRRRASASSFTATRTTSAAPDPTTHSAAAAQSVTLAPPPPPPLSANESSHLHSSAGSPPTAGIEAAGAGASPLRFIAWVPSNPSTPRSFSTSDSRLEAAAVAGTGAAEAAGATQDASDSGDATADLVDVAAGHAADRDGPAVHPAAPPLTHLVEGAAGGGGPHLAHSPQHRPTATGGSNSNGGGDAQDASQAASDEAHHCQVHRRGPSWSFLTSRSDSTASTAVIASAAPGHASPTRAAFGRRSSYQQPLRRQLTGAPTGAGAAAGASSSRHPSSPLSTSRLMPRWRERLTPPMMLASSPRASATRWGEDANGVGGRRSVASQGTPPLAHHHVPATPITGSNNSTTVMAASAGAVAGATAVSPPRLLRREPYDDPSCVQWHEVSRRASFGAGSPLSQRLGSSRDMEDAGDFHDPLHPFTSFRAFGDSGRSAVDADTGEVRPDDVDVDVDDVVLGDDGGRGGDGRAYLVRGGDGGAGEEGDAGEGEGGLDEDAEAEGDATFLRWESSGAPTWGMATPRPWHRSGRVDDTQGSEGEGDESSDDTFYDVEDGDGDDAAGTPKPHARHHRRRPVARPHRQRPTPPRRRRGSLTPRSASALHLPTSPLRQPSLPHLQEEPVHRAGASREFLPPTPSEQGVPHSRTCTNNFADAIARLPPAHYEPPMPSNRNTFTAFVPLSDITSSQLLATAAAVFRRGREESPRFTVPPAVRRSAEGVTAAGSSGQPLPGEDPLLQPPQLRSPETPATVDTLLLDGYALPVVYHADPNADVTGAAMPTSPLHSSVSTAPMRHVSRANTPVTFTALSGGGGDSALFAGRPRKLLVQMQQQQPQHHQQHHPQHQQPPLKAPQRSPPAPAPAGTEMGPCRLLNGDSLDPRSAVTPPTTRRTAEPPAVPAAPLGGGRPPNATGGGGAPSDADCESATPASASASMAAGAGASGSAGVAGDGSRHSSWSAGSGGGAGIIMSTSPTAAVVAAAASHGERQWLDALPPSPPSPQSVPGRRRMMGASSPVPLSASQPLPYTSPTEQPWWNRRRTAQSEGSGTLDLIQRGAESGHSGGGRNGGAGGGNNSSERGSPSPHSPRSASGAVVPAAAATLPSSPNGVLRLSMEPPTLLALQHGASDAGSGRGTRGSSGPAGAAQHERPPTTAATPRVEPRRAEADGIARSGSSSSTSTTVRSDGVGGGGEAGKDLPIKRVQSYDASDSDSTSDANVDSSAGSRSSRNGGGAGSNASPPDSVRWRRTRAAGHTHGDGGAKKPAAAARATGLDGHAGDDVCEEEQVDGDDDDDDDDAGTVKEWVRTRTWRPWMSLFSPSSRSVTMTSSAAGVLLGDGASEGDATVTSNAAAVVPLTDSFIRENHGTGTPLHVHHHPAQSIPAVWSSSSTAVAALLAARREQAARRCTESSLPAAPAVSTELDDGVLEAGAAAALSLAIPAAARYSCVSSGVASTAATLTLVAVAAALDALVDAEAYGRACLEESAGDVQEAWTAVWAALRVQHGQLQSQHQTLSTTAAFPVMSNPSAPGTTSSWASGQTLSGPGEADAEGAAGDSTAGGGGNGAELAAHHFGDSCSDPQTSGRSVTVTALPETEPEEDGEDAEHGDAGGVPALALTLSAGGRRRRLSRAELALPVVRPATVVVLGPLPACVLPGLSTAVSVWPTPAPSVRAAPQAPVPADAADPFPCTSTPPPPPRQGEAGSEGGDRASVLMSAIGAAAAAADADGGTAHEMTLVDRLPSPEPIAPPQWMVDSVTTGGDGVVHSLLRAGGACAAGEDAEADLLRGHRRHAGLVLSPSPDRPRRTTLPPPPPEPELDSQPPPPPPPPPQYRGSSVGQVECRWCGAAYASAMLCPVAGRLHSVLRAERRDEKKAKRAAQALLTEGHVAEAVALLERAGVYAP